MVLENRELKFKANTCAVTGKSRVRDVEGGRYSMGASRQWGGGKVPRRPRPLLHI